MMGVLVISMMGVLVISNLIKVWVVAPETNHRGLNQELIYADLIRDLLSLRVESEF
jgi:hypothetical protein